MESARLITAIVLSIVAARRGWCRGELSSSGGRVKGFTDKQTQPSVPGLEPTTRLSKTDDGKPPQGHPKKWGAVPPDSAGRREEAPNPRSNELRPL